MYHGGIDIRLMQLDQQLLCWAYLQTHARLAGLVEKLKVMGWKKVLGFHHGWNETTIHEFYATLEVHATNEKLIWMMGTRRFEATFRDLATMVGLDYHKMKKCKLVTSLPMLLVGEMPELHH